MKTLLTIFTLVFTVMFSSTSFAGWKNIGSSGGGKNTFYVDFEGIRKVDGYVYWWELSDYLKPLRGYMSDKIYKQGDCKLFRFKILSFSFHKEPMGRGTGDVEEPITKLKDWKYPPANSANEFTLKSVCNW